MDVSTVNRTDALSFDASENYAVNRQPFDLRGAKLFANQMRWARWLTGHCRSRVDVMHCGDIRPVGYAVRWTHMRTGIPYMLYVNGGDLLRERSKAARSWLKRESARYLFGNAAGIVANSTWCAALASDVMREIGITAPPPVAAIDLGTDPAQFRPPDHTRGAGTSQIILTVARLVPHKGQDIAIRALSALSDEFPELQYVIVGTGEDEARLRDLAAELIVTDRVSFAGRMDDEELKDAYATSTLYVGLSRVDQEINAEGFGISFVEAAASGLPVVAGDSGGVRSAVRDGETGIVVPPTDAAAAASAIRLLLRDPALRARMGEAGRAAVENHYNWDRVAAETREFVRACITRHPSTA